VVEDPDRSTNIYAVLLTISAGTSDLSAAVDGHGVTVIQ
jgi:hypothetical protein